MRKVKVQNMLAYGGGNLLGSGALAISGAWLLYFYTTFCGLTIIEASAIFSIASIVDAISNPVMGILSDSFGCTRLGKRFGRRRFFIMIGIPLMLVYPLLWVHGFTFIYYLCSYIIFELIYTSVMVSYETLPTEMTMDFSVRSQLAGYKAVFGKVANFIASALPGVFFAIYGKSSPVPFFYTALIYGIILFFAILFLYFNSWEQSNSDVITENTDKTSAVHQLKSLFKDMKSVFKLRVFKMHLGMYLFGFGAEWLFTSIFTYFIIFSMHYESATVSKLNSMSSILQLISTVIFIRICIKLGFSKPYRYALYVVIVCMLAYFAVYALGISGMPALILIFAITVVFGLCTGGIYYIPWTVYTFLADFDEIFTGKRRAGLYAGAMTFAGKIVRAIIVFLMGIILAQFGFKSHVVEQTSSASIAIVFVLLIGVILLAVIAILFSKHMTFDKKQHHLIQAEIQRIKEGGVIADVDPETRSAIEKIIGKPYERCWGNDY